jgi:hypothetical protein
MDDVIKEMHVDRAPGPDGFNGLFVKKCCSIIKHDFYQLAADFHNETIQLKNINGSYITLVPKKQSPVLVNDFRPISLTNVCVKFLTKLAANRLQGRIFSCIHKNQYGFLKVGLYRIVWPGLLNTCFFANNPKSQLLFLK